MRSLEDLRAAVAYDLGDLAQLIREESIDLWLNEGQERLDYYRQDSADVSWIDEAEGIEYPSDFVRSEELVLGDSSQLAAGREWGGSYVFAKPSIVRAGSGVLLYWARQQTISGANDSQLPAIGDQACISWAVYRAYKWLTSGRADYRRFSTITQTNGVDISELDAIAERHKSDFDEAKAMLHETIEATTFFG